MTKIIKISLCFLMVFFKEIVIATVIILVQKKAWGI